MIATQNNSLYISKAYLQEEGYKASATVTFGANPIDGHNIVLNGTTFTFRDSHTVANDVQVGVDISTSIDNLLTEALPAVATYTKVGTDSIFIEYNTIGVVGNSYTISSNFTSVPSALSGGSDTPDGDWVDNTPTVEYTPKEMVLEPAETTSTALVGYTPVAQGDAVRVYNGTDGLVDGTLGTTTTTTGTGTTDTHDIFGDGSAVATYKLDGNANDLGGNYNGTATNVTYGTGKFGNAILSTSGGSFDTTVTDMSNELALSFWVNVGLNAGLYCAFGNGVTSARLNIRIGRDSNGNIYLGSQWRDGSGSGAHFYATYIFEGTSTLSGYCNFVFVRVKGVGYDNVYLNTSNISTKTNQSGGGTPTKTFSGTIKVGLYTENISSTSVDSNIDQLRIFNRPPTAQEVQTLYTEQVSKYTSDITSLGLTNPPIKAWKDTPITVSTVTEANEARCIAQDVELTPTGTPTLSNIVATSSVSGLLQTGDSVLADDVLVEPSSIIETDLGGGTYEYDITFDPALAQAPTTLAIPDRSIYPSEASDTYDGTKFVKTYNKVEQQGRAFRYKIEADEGVEVTKLTIPFNKQP